VVAPTILDFRRIVLNLYFFFSDSITKTKVFDAIFFKMLWHLGFMLDCSTNFVGSFTIKVSREFCPNEVRSPEITNGK